MNRFAVGLIISALAHGAILVYTGSSTIPEAPNFNVEAGRSSVDMVFSSAARASDTSKDKNEERTKQTKENKQQDKNKKAKKQSEPTNKKPENEKEPDPGSIPGEKPEQSSTTMEKPPSRQAQPDTTTNPSKNQTSQTKKSQTKQTQTKKEAKKQSRQSAPSSVKHSGAKWVQNADYRSNPPPRYPTRARVRHQEGTVRLLVRINPKGQPLSITVHESSGYRLLDRAARNAVRRWRFVPAKKNGEAVESATIVPVRFSLDR
jgi:protein TonB